MPFNVYHASQDDTDLGTTCLWFQPYLSQSSVGPQASRQQVVTDQNSVQRFPNTFQPFHSNFRWKKHTDAFPNWPTSEETKAGQGICNLETKL